jgi:uncharacterized protein (TIGR02271 family)
MTDQHSAPDRDIVPAGDHVITADDRIRLSLAEETLQARVVERDQGKVLIHKHVETDPVTAQVELHHDDMVIDEVIMDEEATERQEPWYEGDTLMVPVYEEVLVSYTQLILRKVIRVHNRGAVEQVNLTGTVRREVVDIEQVDADSPDTPARPDR